MFKAQYANVFKGDANWRKVKAPESQTYAWDNKSTYVQNPPYFEGITMQPKPVDGHRGRPHPRAVRRQDHHRPHLAGRLDQGGFARRQMAAGRTQVQPEDFNQYGTRRGNHEVMMRGTFANIRIKNFMLADESGNVPEGGNTKHFPGGERCRSTTRR